MSTSLLDQHCRQGYWSGSAILYNLPFRRTNPPTRISEARQGVLIAIWKAYESLNAQVCIGVQCPSDRDRPYFFFPPPLPLLLGASF